jgi:hypothetical protein
MKNSLQTSARCSSQVLRILYCSIAFSLYRCIIAQWQQFYTYYSKKASNLLASMLCSSNHIFANNFGSNRRIFLKF